MRAFNSVHWTVALALTTTSAQCFMDKSYSTWGEDGIFVVFNIGTYT